MAIALDNVVSAVEGDAVTSVQWTHTAAGVNTYLAIFGLINTTAGFSAVAYNGVALTKKLSVPNNGDVTNADGWRLVGNNTGNLTASAVVVGTTARDIFGCSVTYTGVSQGAPDGTALGGSSNAVTNSNLSISTTANMVVLGFIGNTGAGGADYTVGAGMTKLVSAAALNGMNIDLASFNATGATTSLSWSCAVSTNSAFLGWGISATAAAAATGIFTLSMLGVGQ